MGQNPHQTKWIRIWQTASVPTGQGPDNYEQICLSLNPWLWFSPVLQFSCSSRPHTHLGEDTVICSLSFTIVPVPTLSTGLRWRRSLFSFIRGFVLASSLDRVTGSPTFLSLPSNVNPPPSEYLQRVTFGIECRRLRRAEFASMPLHSFAL